jgi:hypothetical protein
VFVTRHVMYLADVGVKEGGRVHHPVTTLELPSTWVEAGVLQGAEQHPALRVVVVNVVGEEGVGKNGREQNTTR